MRPRLVKEVNPPEMGFDGERADRYYLLTPDEIEEDGITITSWNVKEVTTNDLMALAGVIDDEVGIEEVDP